MRKYQRAPGVVARHVAGELVLVSTAPVSGGGHAGEFFVLNESAERLWAELDAERSAGELEQALMRAFEVGESEAAADVAEFIEALCACGVLRESEVEV